MNCFYQFHEGMFQFCVNISKRILSTDMSYIILESIFTEILLIVVAFNPRPPPEMTENILFFLFIYLLQYHYSLQSINSFKANMA